MAHKGEDFQKDYQRGGEATTTSDESQSESPEDKTDQSEIPAEGIFDEPTSQPASQPKAKPVPRVNAMDLLTLHGRHLDYFRGNEAGRQEALDAIAGALDLYDAPAVVAAILGEFKATRAKVHIRDLLSLLARRCLAEQAQAVAVVETGLSMDPKCVAKRAEIRALVLARQQAAVVA